MNVLIPSTAPSLYRLEKGKWTVIATQPERSWHWLIPDRYPSVTCARLRNEGRIITAQRKADNGGYELVAMPAGQRV